MRTRKPIKFKDAKGELNEVLHDEQNLKLQAEPIKKQEEILEQETHVDEDHYHGIHHFDKYGHHDDISDEEFSIKSQFPSSKRSLTFRVAMAGLILGLAILFSFFDTFYEEPLEGLGIELRFLDLTVIIIGIPVVGVIGSIGIAVVEPWFHWAIDPGHTAPQIAFDSVGYTIAVLVFFAVFYLLFKNSPIHKDPNKTKELFKEVIPGFVIVPVLSIIFAAIFALTCYVTKTPPLKTSFVFIDLGIQVARFIVMYIVFVIVERAMKPINHRYR